MRTERIVGVVLTGGQSRRFGSPKAFENFNGKAFYHYSIDALKDIVNEIVVISHPTITERFKKELTRQDILLIEDDLNFIGNGPLAGIYSAMKATEGDWYIVLPCDLPLITKNTIEKIINSRSESDDAVVPISNERIQPLVALYHRSVYHVLLQQLKNSRYRMTDFLSKINVNYLSKDMNHINDFINVNTQDDLKQIELKE